MRRQARWVVQQQLSEYTKKWEKDYGIGSILCKIYATNDDRQSYAKTITYNNKDMLLVIDIMMIYSIAFLNESCCLNQILTILGPYGRPTEGF